MVYQFHQLPIIINKTSKTSENGETDETSKTSKTGITGITIIQSILPIPNLVIPKSDYNKPNLAKPIFNIYIYRF